MPIYEGGGRGRIITKNGFDRDGWIFGREYEYIETEYDFYGWGDTESIANNAVAGSHTIAREVGRAQQYAIKKLREELYRPILPY